MNATEQYLANLPVDGWLPDGEPEFKSGLFVSKLYINYRCSISQQEGKILDVRKLEHDSKDITMRNTLFVIAFFKNSFHITE